MKRTLRLLILLVMGVIGATFITYLWFTDTGYIYRKHWQTDDHLTLDFAQLQAITEQQTLATYPIHWFCRRERSDLGDAFCADELAQWNGIGALDTVFFYQNGKLLHAKVDIPSWHHKEMMAYVQQHYGKPIGYISEFQWQRIVAMLLATGVGVPLKLDVAPQRQGVWLLSSGAWLIVDLRADDNPLQWSTLFWIEAGKVKTLSGQQADQPAPATLSTRPE